MVTIVESLQDQTLMWKWVQNGWFSKIGWTSWFSDSTLYDDISTMITK